MAATSERYEDRQIGRLYDEQAASYAEFADRSFSWQYIESQAFDRYIADLYSPDTRVLDLGCGAGRIIQHLIANGIAPTHVTGVDTSTNLLEMASHALPEVEFEETSASALPFEDKVFDLVTSNMVFHHLDNDELGRAFEEAYRVLKPEGTLFFVDVDPDSSDLTRDPKLVDTWLAKATPWGTSIPHFNREPRTLLIDIPYRTGFDLKTGWALPIDPASEAVNPEEFARYSSKPSRIAARLQKILESDKQIRLEQLDETIPSLTE